MAIVFDGDNLLITLTAPTAGVLNQSVEEIYDEAKQWYLGGENTRFPFPFRTTGGDPLTPGIKSGAYFFLQNQDGWRIISTDEDQTINYSGNLVAEDSVLPIIVETPSRTVLHLGLQPVTQRIDDILTDVQFASFNGGVTVDVLNGTAGTGNDSNGDPIGTMRVPSDNIPDAVTIAANRGLNQIFIIGNITLDTGDVLTNFVMIGESPTLSTITINAGASVVGLELRDAIISGTLDGNSTVFDCHIGTLVFLNGSIHDSLFTGGTLTLGGGAQTNIINCQDGTAGLALVIIDMGGSGQALVMRGCSGGWEITNKSGTEDVSLDVRSGRIVIDDTVTSGTILLRGLGKWDNKDTYIGGANVIDEMVDGVEIKEMYKRFDLDGDQNYADDGSVIVNPDFTLTKVDQGDGTFDVERS